MLAALAAALALAAPAPYGAPQPVRYGLELGWSPASRVLTGQETVVLRNTGAVPLTAVWIRLWPNDSCAARRITLTRVTGARVTGSAAACSAAELTLGRPLAPGASAQIELRFRVAVPSRNDAFGRSAGVDLFGRAVPTLAVRDASGWRLDPDSPIGESAYTLSAAWHAVIHVPAGMSIASTGREVSRTATAVVVDTPHARDFAFAIGRMSRAEAVVDGTRIRVFAASRPPPSVLADAADALRSYSSWFGPYGSPELDLVLTRFEYDGMEYPELVFTDAARETVVHEVAHEWFYGIVGNDQYREPWLDESFAAWSEEQLAPGAYDCDPADPFEGFPYGLSRGMAWFDAHPDDYTDDDYDDVVYRGGSCALGVLASELGRSRFLGLLRREVAAYRYRTVSTAGFLGLVAAEDPAVAASWAHLTHLG